MCNYRSLIVAFIALAGGLGLAPRSTPPALKKVAEFDLPGPPGKRFDYLTFTPDDHYLLSAHLAAKQMYVIDLRTNKVVATVTDTPGVEGVEYVPGLKKAYTSNAYDNTIGVVDLRQMKVIKKIPTEAKPDGSAYAALFHKLCSVSNIVQLHRPRPIDNQVGEEFEGTAERHDCAFANSSPFLRSPNGALIKASL